MHFATSIAQTFDTMVLPEDLADILTAEHGKVTADALGEITRGLEVVEFALGMPQLTKGDYSENVSTGVDVTR